MPKQSGTMMMNPRREDKGDTVHLGQKVDMLRAQVRHLQERLDSERKWMSYIYAMRNHKLSGLFWGMFREYADKQGIPLDDVSFKDLELTVNAEEM